MLLALQMKNDIATWRAHCLRINCAARLTHVVLLVVGRKMMGEGAGGVEREEMDDGE